MELPLPFTQETYEITRRIVAQWMVFGRPAMIPMPSAAQQTLMARYVNTCFFALRHGMDVMPPKGLPRMPRGLMDQIIDHAAKVQYKSSTPSLLQPYRPQPIFPTNWSPIVRSSIRRRNALMAVSRASLRRRAAYAKLQARLTRERTVITVPYVNIWGTSLLAGATAFAMYTWKNMPDPKDLHKIPIEPGELFALMIRSDFDNDVLPRLSGNYTMRDFGFTTGVPYTGHQSLFIQTHADEPDRISHANLIWRAPPPLLNRLTLTFAFNQSNWTNYSYIGFNLQIPLPHKTLFASMAFGWDGWPGWWYCWLLTSTGMVPVSAGLRLKIRDWAICRVDIELPLGLYTRTFFHSTDFPAQNMLLKQVWTPSRIPTSLQIFCGSRTKDSVRFFLDDVYLYNYGNLLPSYDMQSLLDEVTPWLDFDFGQPQDIPLPYPIDWAPSEPEQPRTRGR